MGDKQDGPFHLSFNASLKIDFQGVRVTSDGGLILVRELDKRLGLGDLIEQHLTDRVRVKALSCPFATCCGSRCTAAWRATRISMTPSGSRKIRRSA